MTSNYKNSVWIILIIFLASRLLNVGVFILIDEISGNKRNNFTDTIIAYFASNHDSNWYAAIAENGYDTSPDALASGQTEYAFYPLLPYTARGFGTLLGIEPRLAGVLISNLAFLTALFLFRIYCRERGATEDIATKASLLLAFCPMNFLFSSFYTESLFLAFTLAGLVCFEQKKFYRSAIFSALLTSIRTNGIFILIYYGWDLLKELRLATKERKSLKQFLQTNSGRILTIVATPIGLFTFWWICFLQTGDAFAQKSSVMTGWHIKLHIPFSMFLEHLSWNFTTAFWVCSGFIFFLFSFSLLPKRLFRDFLFCLLNFFIFFGSFNPNCMLRYSIVLFPIYLGLSFLFAKKPAGFEILLATFALLNATLCYAWIAKHYIAI